MIPIDGCRTCCTLLLILVGLLTGCSSNASTNASSDRSPEKSNRLLAKALEDIEAGAHTRAEPLLHQALEADTYNGAAYNALGTVYYQQGKLYQAAQQFRHAARLLPDEAGPLNNLGLVLETANQWDEAAEQYEQALQHQPSNPELLGNYVRARIRRGDSGEAVNELLRELLMHETRSAWREWAEQELARRQIQ